MLSGLRAGTPVYILYKNDLHFSTGKVVSVSTPYPQFNLQQPLMPGNGPVVDLTIEVDGKTETYSRVPTNSSIAEFPDRGVIVSETREGITNEVTAIRSASESAINQMDAHKRIIAACDKLLLDLNPQLKREQEQANEIAMLKQQLSGMSDQIAALTGMLSKSLTKKKED